MLGVSISVYDANLLRHGRRAKFQKSGFGTAVSFQGAPYESGQRRFAQTGECAVATLGGPQTTTALAKLVPAQAGIALRAAQPAGDHRRRFCLSYSYRAESAAGLGAGGRGVGSLTPAGVDFAGTWPPPSALDGSTSPQPNSSSRPLGSSLLALDVSTSNTVSASTSGWRSMSKAATPLT